MMKRAEGLCERCKWMREIVSDRGSRFVLCERHFTYERYAKYPLLPVLKCEGFENKVELRE